MSTRPRPAIDPYLFRCTMGRFTRGVTVVTTVEDDQVHGLTANGFLSVSLDPPLVLISLGEHTRMTALLRRTGRYGVSVLADDQPLHSQHLAERPVVGLDPAFDRIDGTAYLRGAIGRIGCDIVETHPAGDHLLFLGRVTHLAYAEEPRLAFSTGPYRALYADTDHMLFHH